MPCWPRVLFRLVSFLWTLPARRPARVILFRVLCVEKPKHSLNQNLGSLAYNAICIRITHYSTSLFRPDLFGLIPTFSFLFSKLDLP